MKKPKLRELGEAIRALFQGPYTVKYPKEPSPAFPRFRGKPVFNEDICVGCGACVYVCPPEARVLEDIVEDGKAIRRITIRLDKCIFCGECQAHCITKEGTVLTNEYDLATFDRSEAVEVVEKDLVLCEFCGAIIGPKDHILWVARKLGPMAFTNPTLMLSLLQDLGRAAEVPKEEGAPMIRPDRIRVLCPKCKRATTIFDYRR
ncbi:MAG: 4Fe-4S ferredoxin [Candidatus Latescibacterota bacterium]|nr:MAG: 4Fe-4S ferredoxin [Candidatus Latescibacterota bacterium]